MLRSVGLYGRGLKAPSMYELRTWILKEELHNTEQSIDEIKRTWSETGVTIMSDGWSDMKSRSLINILVNNPYGTVFLRSIEASDEVKNADFIFNLLDGVVEEIGEQLVVQVVTDNASAYKAAGHMLMEKRKHLYWCYPCDGTVPLMFSLGLITTLTEGFAMIGRMGKARKSMHFYLMHGSSYSPSRLPPMPLELWAYEPSPFCKIVREVLVELELPHLLHSSARGSPKRQQLLDKVGHCQVPYLDDPNTGVKMFESAYIIEYLRETYALEK
ncbi:hypothetical protein M5K25_000788 [Dendrobium thyrsiflorum]|uniref:GST N-terminal domain-containing protein n=1 Tax=Dendrobium thyrsiflorum TaxID=117978 RepID=A0ABD0VVB8_DENTH